MNLYDLINRTPDPRPWVEGDHIPWDEPGFSARMLREHLSQEHNAASRCYEIVDRQVAWIHNHVLQGVPGRVLDLGCGPGLYASRLARLGHTCTGIDFSPASIEYARQQALADGLNCTYVFDDVRQADLGQDYDLVMMIFGEFNVFRPADAQLILQKAYRALKPSGRLLLEVHTEDVVQRVGHLSASWYTSQGGLFADAPHLVLEDSSWDEAAGAATNRMFVIDPATSLVMPYAQSFQAYAEADYRRILKEAGFKAVMVYPDLGVPVPGQEQDFFVLVAQK